MFGLLFKVLAIKPSVKGSNVDPVMYCSISMQSLSSSIGGLQINNRLYLIFDAITVEKFKFSTTALPI